MKKIIISLTFAIAALTGNAQTVTVSTYNGTDMTQYAGLVKDVKTTRYMFKGWNTISLPYSMTEEQLNEAFGSDCRLEKLEGVSMQGQNVCLNFVNVKSQGIKPNTPYILYFNKESGAVNINLQDVKLDDAASQVFYTTDNGITITMNGAQTVTQGTGLYGILAADNSEAKFVDVTSKDSKFFATRCFIEVSGTTNANLITIHNSSATAISNVNATAKKTDGNAYNLAGQRVDNNAQGIKIINGKKRF